MRKLLALLEAAEAFDRSIQRHRREHGGININSQAYINFVDAIRHAKMEERLRADQKDREERGVEICWECRQEAPIDEGERDPDEDFLTCWDCIAAFNAEVVECLGPGPGKE